MITEEVVQGKVLKTQRVMGEYDVVVNCSFCGKKHTHGIDKYHILVRHPGDYYGLRDSHCGKGDYIIYI